MSVCVRVPALTFERCGLSKNTHVFSFCAINVKYATPAVSFLEHLWLGELVMCGGKTGQRFRVTESPSGVQGQNPGGGIRGEALLKLNISLQITINEICTKRKVAVAI